MIERATSISLGASLTVHALGFWIFSLLPPNQLYQHIPHARRLLEVTYLDRPMEQFLPAEKTEPAKPDLAAVLQKKTLPTASTPSLQDMSQAMTQRHDPKVVAAPALLDKQASVELSKLVKSIPAAPDHSQSALVDAGGPGISPSKLAAKSLPSGSVGAIPVLSERNGQVPRVTPPVMPGSLTSASGSGALLQEAKGAGPQLTALNSYGDRGNGSSSRAPVATFEASLSVGPDKNIGVRIQGEIASRKVVKSAKPSYPDWALRQGIEAVVSLRLVVTADGRVKSDIVLEKTSGYKDLDQVALETIRHWLFEPLPQSAKAEQWGIVNFVFQLQG